MKITEGVVYVYNADINESVEEAIKNNGLYGTGSPMENNYTVLADIHESIMVTAECLGNNNVKALYYFEGKFQTIEDHLEQMIKLNTY